MVPRRVIAIASALLFTAMLVPSAAMSGTRNTFKSPCPDVILYAARGSGEPFDDRLLGAGYPIRALYDALDRRYPARVGVAASDYRAIAVTFRIIGTRVDLPNFRVLLGGPYNRSVAGGIRTGLQDVPSLMRHCEASRFVLAGYSQGAEVIRGIIFSLRAQDQARVSAVVLYGDPWFNRQERFASYRGGFNARQTGVHAQFGPDANQFGPSRGSGLQSYAQRFGRRYDGVIFSYCHRLDLVCQGARGSNGASAHGSYHRDAAAAATDVASRLGAMLAPVTAPPPPPVAPPPPSVLPAPTAVPPGPPPAAPYYSYRVYGTCADGACGLNVRTGPGYTNFAKIGVLNDGDEARIVCQARGERVGPSPATGNSSSVWDRLQNGGWVSDLYITTPNVDQFSPPIPQC